MSYISLANHSKRIFELQKQFPKLLPAKRLKIKGAATRESLEDFSIAIVGTRKPSIYGKNFISSFLSQLRGLNINIVSGGALGVDAFAHSEALKNDLATQAWLVGDVENPAPRYNEPLFRKIIQAEKSALIIPDYLEETNLNKLKPYFWPLRNFWITGAADMLVIVEAGLKSGTWWTVKAAQEFNVPITALPGSVFSPASEGTNAMIARQFATAVEGPVQLKNTVLAAMKDKGFMAKQAAQKPESFEKIVSLEKLKQQSFKNLMS